MLSTCANPACRTPFQYLREGRLYKFETHAGQVAGNKKPARKVEHFWLCGQCAATMTLAMSKQQTVELVLRKPSISRRAAAS